MPESLTATITDLRRRIAAGHFRSEAEISQGVVGGIISGLDWDFHDTRVVAPQFKIGKRKVDYALCHPPNCPAILLEVKDLGKAGAKGERQLFEYCFHQGVPIAVLTDGRVWRFFFPAGQGTYAQRRFARIDLVSQDAEESARVLERYLRAHDVRSGEARRRAQTDYDTIRLEREAASKYGSVWRELLAGPEPALLDLFRTTVEEATGFRPDPRRASQFIRAQLSVKPDPPPPSPQPPPPPNGPSLTYRGQTETFKNGVQVMAAAFGKLASAHPSLCEQFSERHRGKTRRYLAATRKELYPGAPKFEKYSVQLPNRWWLATNCSNSDKLTRIRWACEVAGLEFGRDLVARIPVGSKTKE